MPITAMGKRLYITLPSHVQKFCAPIYQIAMYGHSFRKSSTSYWLENASMCGGCRVYNWYSLVWLSTLGSGC